MEECRTDAERLLLLDWMATASWGRHEGRHEGSKDPRGVSRCEGGGATVVCVCVKWRNPGSHDQPSHHPNASQPSRSSNKNNQNEKMHPTTGSDQTAGRNLPPPPPPPPPPQRSNRAPTTRLTPSCSRGQCRSGPGTCTSRCWELDWQPAAAQQRQSHPQAEHQ